MTAPAAPHAPPRPRPGKTHPRRQGPYRLALKLGLAVLTLLALPVALIGLLRWVDPPLTAFMLADPGPQPLRQAWVPLSALPAHVPLAFVAAEDQRFPFHRGFDLEAIQRALEHNQRGGRVRGASTISQQVARNLFLWRGRSWLRKGLEVPITALIEALWSKARILEVYLNVAELGPGVYGVEAAARHWYGLPAERLSPNQAARLAAILPAPRRYRAEPPGPYVAERAAWIERQMAQLGPGWLGAIVPP